MHRTKDVSASHAVLLGRGLRGTRLGEDRTKRGNLSWLYGYSIPRGIVTTAD